MLTPAQKQQIYQRGFVPVPRVVPSVLIHAARRRINEALDHAFETGDLSVFKEKAIERAPEIAALFNDSPLRALAESAIGTGKIKPVRGGQVALRFSTISDLPAKPGPHLDGMYAPGNGVAQGTIRNFTALVGVLLSDLPRPDAGNLAVWPGSHHLYEQFFRKHGPDSLLDGMPDVDLPEPEQIIGEAGDVVLCHYQLAHGVASNLSPHIRYAVYFRLHHVDHEMNRKECMVNLWLEWEGLRRTTDHAECLMDGK